MARIMVSPPRGSERTDWIGRSRTTGGCWIWWNGLTWTRSCRRSRRGRTPAAAARSPRCWPRAGNTARGHQKLHGSMPGRIIRHKPREGATRNIVALAKKRGFARVVDGSQHSHGCGTAIAYAFPQRKDRHAEGDENERAGIPVEARRADG